MSMLPFLGPMLHEPYGALWLCSKATLLLALAASCGSLMRRRSASGRHGVWALAIAGSLAMPVLSSVAPRIWLQWTPAAQPAPATVPAGGQAAPTRAAALGTPPSPSGGLPAWEVLVGIWFLGAAGLGARLLVAHAGLAALLHRARRAGSRSVEVEGDADAGRWAARRARIFVSDEVGVPITWGILRPVIVLPAAVERWPERRVRAVIAHERAHVSRGDALVQAMGEVVRALFWFNPLAWLALRQLRSEAERACDDCVLRAGVPAVEYADHLVSVARERQGWIARGAALAMARPHDLEGRVAAILDATRPRRAIARRTALPVVLVFISALVPLAGLRPGHGRPAAAPARLAAPTHAQARGPRPVAALLRLLALPYSLVVPGTAAAAPAPATSLQRASSHPMRYHLALPTGWAPGRSWPVVLVIPDASREFESNLQRFIAARGDRPFILVAPEVLTCGGARTRTREHYAYTPAEWDSLQVGDDFAFDDAGIAAVLADVHRNWGGATKAYLTGWEAGGHTVWAQAFRHPERWNAVAPVTPNYQRRGLADTTFSSAPERATLPIHVFRCGAPSGEAATMLPVIDQQTQRARADAGAHGFGAVSVEVVPGVDHGPLPEVVLSWFASRARSSPSSR